MGNAAWNEWSQESFGCSSTPRRYICDRWLQWQRISLFSWKVLSLFSCYYRFDLQKQQWIPVKSMNTSRCTLSAVVSSDCQYIYALGGFNGSSLDLVERYNTMSDEWEFVTPMNHKRFMHEAVCLITHWTLKANLCWILFVNALAWSFYW